MTDMPPPTPAPAPAELIYPSSPPKEPVLIGVCNLLLACVGYFIMGQWQKGVAAIAAALVIGIPTCGLGVGAVCIATAIDGYMQAEALKNGFPVAQWTFFKDHR